MAGMSAEEAEWCAENREILRRLMEGDWQAVPVRPDTEMIEAMAAHRGRELLQWYAALRQVPKPTATRTKAGIRKR